jgi:hypothetical protein
VATSPQESDALNPAAMTATILNDVAALRGVAFLNPHYFLANNADEEIWQGALIVVRQRKPGFRLVQGGCVGRPGSTSLRSANFSMLTYPSRASKLQSQLASIHSERNRWRSIRQPPAASRMR